MAGSSQPTNRDIMEALQGLTIRIDNMDHRINELGSQVDVFKDDMVQHGNAVQAETMRRLEQKLQEEFDKRTPQVTPIAIHDSPRSRASGIGGVDEQDMEDAEEAIGNRRRENMEPEFDRRRGPRNHVARERQAQNRRANPPPVRQDHGYYDSDPQDDGYERNDRRNNRNNEPDQNLKGIKFDIPTFRGTSDPDEFLEWKESMELIFNCHNYADIKKVNLAVCAFKEYALVWWQKKVHEIQRNGYDPIQTWATLTRVMDNRFVPSHYRQDLYDKIQFLVQGNKSVEEYHKEMEILLMKAGVEEDEAIT